MGTAASVIAVIGIFAIIATAVISIYIAVETSDKKCEKAHNIAIGTAIIYSIIAFLMIVGLVTL